MSRYFLKNSKPLKTYIDDCDYEEIIKSLIRCWKEIHKQFPTEYDESNLRNDLNDIEHVHDNLLDPEDIVDFDIEKEIDNLVDDLYAYCIGYDIAVY